MAVGNYTVTLSVWDISGNLAIDDVIITIVDRSTNIPNEANIEDGSLIINAIVISFLVIISIRYTKLNKFKKDQ
ncbi:MAG: hypothetical protein INQ03_20135 [Candidatus Heimdallarchaeota archaeon]|nr:hypothetical protein [Candidatus Heimdallarchaeota archaeon]